MTSIAKEDATTKIEDMKGRQKDDREPGVEKASSEAAHVLRSIRARAARVPVRTQHPWIRIVKMFDKLTLRESRDPLFRIWSHFPNAAI